MTDQPLESTFASSQNFELTDVLSTGRELGRGAYGCIEEVLVYGTRCAAKKIHNEFFIFGSAEEREHVTSMFMREYNVMSTLRHPNVVQFLGVYHFHGSLLPSIVMERMDTSLHELLTSTDKLSIATKISVLLDVARGLHYLHCHVPTVIHRDLTARNVLLTSGGCAKIADMGVARMLELKPGQSATPMTYGPGNICYMPPEAVDHPPQYNESLDIFSFGHLSLFVFTQVFPKLRAPTCINATTNEVEGVIEIDRRKESFDSLKELLGEQDEIVALVRRCLQNCPDHRPNTLQLIQQLEKSVTTHGCSSISKYLYEVGQISDMKVKLLIDSQESESFGADNNSGIIKHLGEDSVTLQVSTEGPSPSSYQWWKDGEQIGSETHPYCHGADTPILHISPVESGCGGVYKCVVSHTAVSNSANITLEPLPRFDHYIVSINHQSFMFGGHIEKHTENKHLLANSVEVFDQSVERWKRKSTSGEPPKALYEGACCVSPSGDLYFYGGNDLLLHEGNYSSVYHGELHKLNSKTLEWSQVLCESTPDGPMKKIGCQMVCFSKGKLALFGGCGRPHGAVQIGASLEKIIDTCWNNELHTLDTNEENPKWISLQMKGTRPLPCSHFTLTSINDCEALFFGGRRPKDKLNEVYAFNFSSMKIIECQCGSEEKPEGRASHAACCLGFNSKYPQLFIIGGISIEYKALNDAWLFDVSSKMWKRVKPTELKLPDFKPICGHAATAVDMGKGITKVTIFGGCHEYNSTVSDVFQPRIAETTILTFEFDDLNKTWLLKDIAYNTQLGNSCMQ